MEQKSFCEIEEIKEVFNRDTVGMTLFSNRLFYNCGSIVPIWEASEWDVIQDRTIVRVPYLSKYKIKVRSVSSGRRPVFLQESTYIKIIKDNNTSEYHTYLVFEYGMDDGDGFILYVTPVGDVVRVDKYDQGKKKRGLYIGNFKTREAYRESVSNLLGGIAFSKVSAVRYMETKSFSDSLDVDMSGGGSYGGELPPAVIIGDSSEGGNDDGGNGQGNTGTSNDPFDPYDPGDGGNGDGGNGGGGGCQDGGNPTGDNTTHSGNNDPCEYQDSLWMISGHALQYNARQCFTGYLKGVRDCMSVAKDFLAFFGVRLEGASMSSWICHKDSGITGMVPDGMIAFERGVNTIIDNINNGIPVVIGVNENNFMRDSGNYNKGTNHFIVITGYLQLSEFYYQFRFVETGRSEANWSDATSDDNFLTCDVAGMTITGYSFRGGAGEYFYQVTEIRDNQSL